MSIDPRCRHDRPARELAAGMFDEGRGARVRRQEPGHPRQSRAKMAADVPGRREGRAAGHGQDARETRLRDQGRRGQGRGGGRDVQARGDGALRNRELQPAGPVVPAVPRGRRRGAQAQAEGQAEGVGREGRADDPRAGAWARGRESRGAGGVPKKTDGPGGGAALPNQEKALAAAEPSGQGHDLADPLGPPDSPGRATTARCPIPRRRPGRSCARGSPRSSAGSRTASDTGRWPVYSLT